jgi:hypothetical protein
MEAAMACNREFPQTSTSCSTVKRALHMFQPEEFEEVLLITEKPAEEIRRDMELLARVYEEVESSPIHAQFRELLAPKPDLSRPKRGYRIYYGPRPKYPWGGGISPQVARGATPGEPPAK